MFRYRSGEARRRPLVRLWTPSWTLRTVLWANGVHCPLENASRPKTATWKSLQKMLCMVAGAVFGALNAWSRVRDEFAQSA